MDYEYRTSWLATVFAVWDLTSLEEIPWLVPGGTGPAKQAAALEIE